jgi:hypothetical protein
METQEFIDKFEEKAKLIKNSATFKGTYYVIKVSDWEKLKKKYEKHFMVDDDYLEEYKPEDD